MESSLRRSLEVRMKSAENDDDALSGGLWKNLDIIPKLFSLLYPKPSGIAYYPSEPWVSASVSLRDSVLSLRTLG